MIRAIVILCALSACRWQPGDAVTPVLGDGAPSTWKAAWHERVAEAVANWNAALCGPAFTFDPHDGLPVVLHVYSDWNFPSNLGYAPGDEAHIRGPRADGELGLLVDVIMHELGHVLNIGHSPDPTSIMRSPASVTMPNADDIRIANHILECAP